MRKLVLFNRQMNVASDDFVFPGLLEVSLRCIGLAIITFEFLRYLHYLDQGSTGLLVHSYLTGVIVFFLVTILVDVMIVRISMRGTITDDRQRRNIALFIHLRFLIMFVEFLWTVFGTGSILLHLPEALSQPRVYWIACLSVAGGWVTTAAQVGLVFSTFNFRSDLHLPVITGHDWEKRWQFVCCCLNASDNRHVFSTLGKLCSSLFKKEEIPGSDIVCGLILVYHRQHKTRQQLDVVDAPLLNTRLRCAPNKLAVSPSAPRQHWMNIREAAHYMKFALGAYGWFYYIGLNNPVVATCKLLPELNWIKTTYSQIEDDGKLQANTAAFTLQTGIQLKDIVCASFHNEIYAIPFYVSIDTESQSVVVAIRGTLSLEDVLTDLVVVRAPVCFGGIRGHVHTGMYHSAKYIRNRLIADDILGRAFSRAKGYRLVITGHSLGGGVAALLAMELRPMYPHLMCFAFSTPGELVSSSLIPYTEEFVCSVVLGYDVVPRLGLLNFAKLRLDILNALRNCDIPKHKVIAVEGIWKTLFETSMERMSSCQLDVTTHTELSAWFDRVISQEEQEVTSVMTTYEPLYPPGQILHVLEKQDDNRAWSEAPEYYVEWVNCSTFGEIVLSRRMIAHHFPDTLLAALRQLAAHFDLEGKKDS